MLRRFHRSEMIGTLANIWTPKTSDSDIRETFNYIFCMIFAGCFPGILIRNFATGKPDWAISPEHKAEHACQN